MGTCASLLAEEHPGNMPLPSSPPPPPPSRYELRGATIDAPRDWAEESVLTLTSPGPHPPPKLSLVRVSVSVDTTLELFAARRVAELSKVLGGLQIAESRELLMGGHRAMQLRLFWEELEGRVNQRLVLTRAEGAVFVLSINWLEEQAAIAQSVFDSAVASFRFSPPAGASKSR